MATTMVQDTVKQWRDRLKELRPSVDEFHEIESALNAVEGRNGGDGPATPRTTRQSGNGSTRGRGRPGKRAQQFFDLVKGQPGITVSEAAKKMGIQPNYIYRVSATLMDQGLVKKEGQGYAPVGESLEGGE